MNKATTVVLAAAFALGFAGPSLADHKGGKVQEIIIKIQTKDGVKHYKVGKDVELLRIQKGSEVDFDYADDDVIERIEAVPDEEEEAQPAAD